MGVANIVPGISGGAMLLILGVYHAFLDAIAACTTLRFRLHHIVTLACIGAGAGTSILLLAGIIRDAIVNNRWQTYSIVAGTRIAAVPIVWRLARPATPSLWAGMLAGLVLTAGAAAFTYSPAAQSGLASSPLMNFTAGLLGASATILPGMDGSYILMLLGQYVPILGAIDRFADALRTFDTDAMLDACKVLIPTGIGVAIGIGGVAIAMKWLLARFPKPTYGVLLGVLLGAFIGLYPFGAYRAPVVGDRVAGQTLTIETLPKYQDDKDKWPLEFFTPTTTQVALSLALLALGFAAGWALTKLEREDKRSEMAP
jgi:putative membrane protein